MMIRWMIVSIFLSGLLLTACGALPAAPTPSALPPTEVALEIVDTVTASPLPATPTAMTTTPPTDISIPPSKTLTPTLQYTYTPTTIPPTPTVEGWRTPSGEIGLVKGREWFVFADEDTGQIGGFNVDGTGMTWYDLPPMKALRSRTETHKNFMAYIIIDEFNNSVELVVVKFPQGEIIAQIPIASTDYQDDIYVNLYQESIGVMDWALDGEYLAIAAMPNEEWTDLYLYRRGSSYIEKIIHEDGFINNIIWFEDNTIRYTSNRHPSVKRGTDYVDASVWVFDVSTEEKTLNKTFFYESTFGLRYPGRAIFSNDDNTVKVIIPNPIVSHDDGGVFIQTNDDEEPRLVFETEYSYRIYQWIESAKRFIVGNGKELVVFDERGIIDFRMDFYKIHNSAKNVRLTHDETMAAIISSSGLLKIYELNDGFHEIWTVPEPVAVDQFFWYPDGTQLIVAGLGHVYHVDLINRTVNLLIYDGANSFSTNYGFWMSQSP